MHRYGRAAFRYLLGAVRDPDAAVTWPRSSPSASLRGDFRRGGRQRGRFRDYLKRAIMRIW